MTATGAVAIFTLAEDIHGHLVADHVRRLGHRCHLVATDRMAFAPSLSWRSGEGGAAIRDIDGAGLDPARLDAVWWRRVAGGGPVPGEGVDEAARTLVPGECRAALAGAVLSRFRGRWINDPAAEIRADNKLVQLDAAQAAGLDVPETLVSAEPARIRGFLDRQDGRLVVKAVRGTAAFSIPARLVGAADLASDAALEACPAIYQEVVEGSRHLRVHVFGEEVIAVRIASPHLDWRPDLDVPMEPVRLEDGLAARLAGLVKGLGLAMGILDLKLREDGQPVFLEINPQGQFAFVEGLTGLPLAGRMAAFLTSAG
ncbi:ATP-grasp domain-containing protein [Marinimicrococcus flavescens]|uniref:ATP-grasp domain-containing protein n=1 Tax=Marinimicrococcus flavescens TaxID=3031815 RepID=A0AAP4D6E1_9PROT|nr:hypothetical protein [Marinimicrococcus flavescens]